MTAVCAERLDVRIGWIAPTARARSTSSQYLTPAVPIHAAEELRAGGPSRRGLAGMITRAVDALYTRDETTALFLR